MKNSPPLWVLLLLMLAWAAWLFRYEWHTANNRMGEGNNLYRCDRWTGQVERAAGSPL